MKHLTDVLKSSMTSLYESIFDDDIVTRQADLEEYIKDFLQKNYNLNPKHIIINQNKKTKEYKVDVKGSVHTHPNIKSLTNGLFEFGCISGNFDCSGCTNLKSLEGAPKEVSGEFDCSHCDNLSSIKGAPKKCISFYCYFCKLLKSLEGAPKEVRDVFNCSHCKNLTSLEGAPKEVTTFRCGGCDKLKSLEGAPEVCDDFDCNACVNITSLDGLRNTKKLRFISCAHCEKLTKVDGLKHVNDILRIQYRGCEHLQNNPFQYIKDIKPILTDVIDS